MTATSDNKFKAALAQGRRQIGVWLALASPIAAEIAAGAGFDWALIDAEHGPNDLASILAQLQAMAPYPVTPILRPRSADPNLIKQYLELGVETLLFPMIDSIDQARAAVAAMRYPPAGVRGVGAAVARSSRWGRTPDYVVTANRRMCTLVQVESVTAVAATADIAAVDGVDGIFIGPADLAASMGHLGNMGHPDVLAAVDTAAARAMAAGKAVGTITGDEALARRYLDQGFTFVAVTTDTLLFARTLEGCAARFRG